MKKLIAIVFAMVMLVACNKAQSAPVVTPIVTPASDVSTPVPTATSTPKKVEPVWSQWEIRGFGRITWNGEVKGKNSGCVVDLQLNPKACTEPILVRPQVDTIVVKNNEYFAQIAKGEVITVDFNDGEYQFFAYDAHGNAFESDFGILSAITDEDETPVLVNLSNDKYVEYINLADGRTYRLQWKEEGHFLTNEKIFTHIWCGKIDGNRVCEIVTG